MQCPPNTKFLSLPSQSFTHHLLSDMHVRSFNLFEEVFPLHSSSESHCRVSCLFMFPSASLFPLHSFPSLSFCLLFHLIFITTLRSCHFFISLIFLDYIPSSFYIIALIFRSNTCLANTDSSAFYT